MKRIQEEFIKADLQKKMVLLVGPRQSGKTWLAKEISKSYSRSLYLNYDQIQDRRIIQDQSWLPATDLLIFDELHKMDGWKNYLKGVFDTKPDHLRILVTGSARLEIYDQLGDSLAGRYFRHRLLPFSLAELTQASESIDLNRLMERGGFPEPFLAPDTQEAERWRFQYVRSLLSTDVFDVDTIHNLKALHLLFQLLRHRVGSPVSYQSLSEDMAVSPTTVKKYIQILEALFIIFIVPPFSKNIARSLLKEPKIYFFDTGLVKGDDGAKFENLVAISLLKHVYGKVDYKAQDYTLNYLRTKEGDEVDFALVLDEAVYSLIEVKVADTTPAKSLLKFHKKYGYPAIQLVQSLRNDHQKDGIQLRRAEGFLSELYL